MNIKVFLSENNEILKIKVYIIIINFPQKLKILMEKKLKNVILMAKTIKNIK